MRIDRQLTNNALISTLLFCGVIVRLHGDVS